jgi:hypothetical protein
MRFSGLDATENRREGGTQRAEHKEGRPNVRSELIHESKQHSFVPNVCLLASKQL